ncbi:hypothetical protein KQH56_01500 [bacterium]|nr:hypothetical protein [bacterium]
MAYIYQIGFNVAKDQMSELEIGSSLERTLGYLKTLLPSQDGFIYTRAMHTMPNADPVHFVIESAWNTWEDFQNHVDSNLAEDKILKEFQPHVELEDLTTCVFDEVS